MLDDFRDDGRIEVMLTQGRSRDQTIANQKHCRSNFFLKNKFRVIIILKSEMFLRHNLWHRGSIFKSLKKFHLRFRAKLRFIDVIWFALIRTSKAQKKVYINHVENRLASLRRVAIVFFLAPFTLFAVKCPILLFRVSILSAMPSRLKKHFFFFLKEECIFTAEKVVWRSKFEHFRENKWLQRQE